MNVIKVYVLILLEVDLLLLRTDGERLCSCYTFSKNLWLWPQARNYCKNNNKILAVMESEQEWQFITTEIQNKTGTLHGEWFIGLKQNLTTRRWNWINGEPLTIDRWHKGGTNPDPKDSYGVIHEEYPSGFKGSLSTIRSNLRRGWICEEETDTCTGICFHHPVPTSASFRGTSTGTKGATTQGKTSTQQDVTAVSHHLKRNGSSYVFYQSNTTARYSWIQSRQRCRKAGCDLVSIETPDEWEFLKQAIQKLQTTEYFIGLRKDKSSRKWQWVSDNSAVSASRGNWPWARGEPSNNSEPENCAQMYKDYKEHYGLYNNIGCKAKMGITGYICEGTNGCYVERVVTKVGDLNCKNNNDYFTLYLTIAVLAGFLFVISVILFGVLRLQQKKQQQTDARKETVLQNQHDFGESLPLNALNVGAQPSLAAGNERNRSEPFVQQESVYTALCSETMMTSGEDGSRTYTSLVKSTEDSDLDYVNQIPAPEYVNA